MIIGFCGNAGAGKDTAADVAHEFRFVKVALADPMKRICREVYDFTDEQLWGSSQFRNMPDRRYPRRPDYWEYPHTPAGAVWLPLHNGRGFFLIDAEDVDEVMKHRWTLNKKESGKNTDYVRATIEGEKVSLHTFLTSREEDRVVDHFNGNGLDNRRKNLRVCTKAENRQNSAKRKDGESVFKGVGRASGRDGWRAYINIRGQLKTIGYYASEEEAALAYDSAAVDYFGGFARLNAEMFLTPRYALQKLGTEWGRNNYNNTWVDLCLRTAKAILEEGRGYSPERGLIRLGWLDNFEPVGIAISDVRFLNEVEAIRAAGGKVVRIDRPVTTLTGEAAKHVSETEQNSIPDSAFDVILKNNNDLQHFKFVVAEMMRGFLSKT